MEFQGSWMLLFSKKRFTSLLEMTQIRDEMIESSSLKGKVGRGRGPQLQSQSFRGFYIWQEVAYLCLHQRKPPGEYSTQNPQEECGHTFQSSLDFKNPPSLKGKTPREPISRMKSQEKKIVLWQKDDSVDFR